jgi:hypothetical protein
MTLYVPKFLQCSASDSDEQRKEIKSLNEVSNPRNLDEIVQECKRVRTEATLTVNGKYVGRVHADGSFYLDAMSVLHKAKQQNCIIVARWNNGSGYVSTDDGNFIESYYDLFKHFGRQHDDEVLREK